MFFSKTRTVSALLLGYQCCYLLTYYSDIEVMLMLVIGMICRHQDRPVNVDDIDYFYSQSANERVPCDALPDINLQPWSEAPPAPPAHPPAPQAPAPYVEPRAAPLLPVATKAGRTAVEKFVDEVAPARRRPVFREHGLRA